MFTRILLASDEARDALQAARLAAALASRNDATLTVIHVGTPAAAPVAGPAGAVWYGTAYYEASAEGRHQPSVPQTCALLDAAKVTYTLSQQCGDPAETIIRAARNGEADLIVVGSRGWNAAQTFLLGSVSDRVAHHAHCSVLVARGGKESHE